MQPAMLVLLALPAQAEPERLQFKRDVVPALTRAGCNSGACHGSFAGRGGFRLSLLGFDPELDFDALTREARGRRVFPAAPEQSLLLMKPTGTIPHGGGKKLVVDDPSYRILRDWMRQGLAGPSPKDPTLTKLAVTPSEAVAGPHKELALRVQATWSDGIQREVTAWSLFESNKDVVAEVSATGKVKTEQPGRAAIMVRYQGHAVAVPVTVPYGQTVTGNWPSKNYIDDHLAMAWKQVGLEPAPDCDDATFLRRVSLDLIGVLPTVEEIRRFLDDKSINKRDRLVEALLERPEYVDYWSLKWGDLLRVHRRALGEKGLISFNTWLRTALRENRPFDGVVRELLTSRGNLYQSGAAAFYYIDQNPQDLAETTAQVFLGVRLACAKCHHHPFEVWSQDDYHHLAAFFARVQRKDTKEDGLFGGAQSVSLAPTAEYRHPRTNQLLQPRVLGGQPLNVAEKDDPRRQLAEWITSKENPFFARNLANRAWASLMGRGLVDPVDDLRGSNPPSHPALLDALADDLRKNNYDLKRLLKAICQSRAYQLQSDMNPKVDKEGVFFARYRPRRLPAEVLLDAVNRAAGTHEDFTGMPIGTRAISLPDPAVVSTFLDTFGRPRRTTSCDCERLSASDLAQVLHLVNSNKLHQKVTDKQGRVAKLLAEKKPDAALVEELYLATLSRSPTKEEQETIAKLLAAAPSRQEGFEDLMWTLLNLTEFGWNR